MSTETAVLDRLYRTLVEEIRSNRPELLTDSFTVAEIYQNLVPYRTHRDRIGTEMNGDYEHALLRLLAGDGGYLRLESDAARRRLREELDSIHPDTGLYRNFAACEVHLDEERLSKVGGAMVRGANGRPEALEPRVEAGGGSPVEEGVGGPEAPDSRITGASPDPGRDVGGGGDVRSEEEAPQHDVPVDGEAAGESTAGADGEEARSGEEDGTCLWCRESLPDREDLRFCPYCGSRVDLRPCPECGTELEADWLFCLACGVEAGD